MNEYEYKYEDKCWFNGSCYIQKTKGCNRFCALRREFDYLLFASEVPEKFKSYEKLLTRRSIYRITYSVRAFSSLIFCIMKSNMKKMDKI